MNHRSSDDQVNRACYAKRKTEELRLENLQYMQADILDLNSLNKQFDIIESLGVLHHLDDPLKGWEVLASCLSHGGLMKIGLYSELARQNIAKIRKEIRDDSIQSDRQSIKVFRNYMINSNKPHHKKISNSGDFYSLSTIRDLLFHVQEHSFTLPMIKDALPKLGLKFCGFEAPQIVEHFIKSAHVIEDTYDLDKWQSYEKPALSQVCISFVPKG